MIMGKYMAKAILLSKERNILIIFPLKGDSIGHFAKDHHLSSDEIKMVYEPHDYYDFVFVQKKRGNIG